MTPARFALLMQLATTLPLVGLIWFVQIVAYPLFGRVEASSFANYHAAHTQWVTWVVAPLMLGELASASAGVWLSDPAVPRAVAWIGVALVVLLWGITALVSVPLHNTLAGGFDAHAHQLLVSTNGLRTAAWTARGGLLLWVVARALAPTAR